MRRLEPRRAAMYSVLQKRRLRMNGKIGKILIAILLAAVLSITGCMSTDQQTTASGQARTSIELAMAMGNGINLGNTMEAYGRPKFGTSGSPTEYETFWGQPVTTQNIVSAFKKAGFDSLRIPVAWTNTMNFEKGDYAISDAYLNRVGEIINYALKADMYVMINDHWDGGWWGMFGSADENTRKAAMDMYVSLWTQIAEKYSDFSDHVIFESANEELGNRLNDKDIATDSGTLSENDCYAMMNKINQAFVDTVRKTGGKNTERFLLIAGYNTDIEKTCDERFVIPTDTAKDRLLISVHYYAPSDYCINTSVNHWGSRQEYSQMNALFKKMTKFTNAGYGVVVGEYGVSLKQDGSIKDNTIDYLGNVLNNCDVYGYCPVLWDCSSLFKRTIPGFMDKDIAELFGNHSLAAQKDLSQDQIEISARIDLGSALANAKEAPAVAPDTAIAWIMYNSGDWALSYSVGDKYNPTSKSDGLVPTDAPITGPGTYTVALDFSKTAAGFAKSVGFSAVAIANGEKLFPGYVIDIKEILIDGKPYEMTGTPYTTSDDGQCTRVNLYNVWVPSIPNGIRVAGGDASKVTARLLNNIALGNIKMISVTFEFRKL
jgi:endoglucanase